MSIKKKLRGYGNKGSKFSGKKNRKCWKKKFKINKKKIQCKA